MPTLWHKSHGRNSVNKGRKEKTMKKNIITSIALTLFLSVAPTLVAFTIEKNEQVPVQNNFVVGPAKIEASIARGEAKAVSVIIDNKTGRTQTFAINFEDFVGSAREDQTVSLLGETASETSLKEFLSVEKTRFTLAHGDRAIVPVTIAIPIGEKSGGKFAAVVVSAVSDQNIITDTDRAYTGAIVIGRIASLLFVTVPGDVKNEGVLTALKTKNGAFVFGGSEVPFRVVYTNTGNVSLNPYGVITVRNMFGGEVTKTVLDPWFSLPNSIRTRDVAFYLKNHFGFYTATAEVNRGYENIVDKKSVSFVLVPPAVQVVLSFIAFCIFVVCVSKVRGNKKLA